MKPRLTAIRKLSKHGNSWMVAPPRAFLHALDLVGGEYLELVLDEYSRRFYVRPLKPSTRSRARRLHEQLPLEEVL